MSTDDDIAADSHLVATPQRPGKIIAIHLSYASRADQRGRRPRIPRTSSSRPARSRRSGGTIERPAGTELLAFEGEIALVIGTPARRVRLADAWDHVGRRHRRQRLRPLRPARQRQGLQRPLEGRRRLHPDWAPTLIDARAVDPAALRLRTWVNGELVQDDTTDRLLFPSRSWSPTCPSTSPSRPAT